MQWNAVEVFNISIHALREEGDVWIDRRNY